MPYTCQACGSTVLRRRNGRLECARCGAPAGGYLPQDDLLWEQKSARGRAFLLARRWTEAEGLYRELRDLRPEDPEGYLGLAAALSRNYSLSQPAVPGTLAAARNLLGAGRSLPPAAGRYLEKELSLKKEAADHSDMIFALWNLVCVGLVVFFFLFATGGHPGRAVLSVLALIPALGRRRAAKKRRAPPREALKSLEDELKLQ